MEAEEEDMEAELESGLGGSGERLVGGYRSKRLRRTDRQVLARFSVMRLDGADDLGSRL